MKKAKLLVPMLIFLLLLAARNDSGPEESQIDTMVLEAAAADSEDGAMAQLEAEISMEAADEDAGEPMQVDTDLEMIDQAGDLTGEAEDIAAEPESEEMSVEPEGESEEMAAEAGAESEDMS